MSLDPERRHDVFAAKLRAVVAGRWGPAPRAPHTFPRGAALSASHVGWVLAEEDPARALGPALLWALRSGIRELHLLAAAEAGPLARRAGLFTSAARVWQIDGRSTTEASPDPVATEPPLPSRAAALADVLRAGGAEPVVEHGVLTGEVRGLEVARVVVDGHGAYLEVGVGKHDREAHRVMHGDVPPAEVLARVVRTVAERRRRDVEPHPINRLARERWLRASLVARPEQVGAAHLAPVPSPVVPDDLRKHAPAPAAGVDLDGRPLLVVCSTGVDLDLVPAAADARLRDGRGPRLVLAVPARDDHPVTRQLAARLVEPAEVHALPEVPWPPG